MQRSLRSYSLLRVIGFLPLAWFSLACGEDPTITHTPGESCNTEHELGAAGASNRSSVAPSRDAPIGWAAVAALDLEGTTGGNGGEVVEATSWPQMLTALAGSTPRVVRIRGRIEGEAYVGSNKTLEGIDGAVVEGSLRVEGVENVIIRNLTIQGYNCSDKPEDCSGGDDAVEVRSAHHVWLDHVAIFDGSDGNLDITNGSDYVTVSWSKFWYSGTDRDHRFSTLIGSADENPIDEGKLKVTFHHNWWAKNVDQRMPRTRYGRVHVFNNLYTAEGNSYCASAGWDARLLLEDNYFKDVNSPHTVRERGNLLSRGNVYDGVEGELQETGEGFDPPYRYDLDDSPCNLPELIEGEAGPH